MTQDREQWLRAHRHRMADFRARRVREKKCRQCDRPAKIGKNGRPMKMCAEHLEQDAERVSSRQRKARASE